MNINANYTLTNESLAQFYGTENYYRQPLHGKLIYTDGVKYVAEHGGAYWLLDAIASYQHTLRTHKDARLREMQFWSLSVDPQTHKALLTCVPDSDEEPVVRQEIEMTDFPLDEIKIWVEQGGINGEMVMMLPSER